MGKRLGMSLLVFIIAAAQFGFTGMKGNVAQAAEKSMAQKAVYGLEQLRYASL